MPGFSLVGEASNGQQVLDQLPNLEVDVVLMDVQMPVMNGISTTQYITQHYPEIKILGMSSQDEPYYREDMLRAGALGCIPKIAPTQLMAEAVKTVARGQTYTYHES